MPVVIAQAQAILAHDTNARLSQLEMPTLVIHGTEDQMLPVGNGQMIAERIPQARLEIFDGVGHLFFWERPRVGRADPQPRCRSRLSWRRPHPGHG